MLIRTAHCLMIEGGKAKGLSAVPSNAGLGKQGLEKTFSFFESHRGQCWERAMEWQDSRERWPPGQGRKCSYLGLIKNYIFSSLSFIHVYNGF